MALACKFKNFLPRRAAFSLLNCSTQSVPETPAAVDKKLLAKLRKETGFTFANCRKALVLHDNNIEKATDWLNAEAEKEGWSQAIKLQTRVTTHGVIGTILNNDHTQGVLVEVNCETDFVARNIQFLQLVSSVSKACMQELSTKLDQKLEMDGTTVKAFPCGNSGDSIADVVAREIGTIRENINVQRCSILTADRSIPGQFLSTYSHTSGLNADHMHMDGCSFGKYSALVLLQSLTDSAADMESATQIAQHVVGVKPTLIGEDVEDPEVEVVDSKENEASYEDKAKANRKEDQETRLLHQEFLLEPGMTTGKWLKSRNLKVVDFIRYGLGETSV